MISAGRSKATPHFANGNCYFDILALYSAGLAPPEVDPELGNREEPFFDQNARQILRWRLA
jgi:hypothetical protein